MGYSQGLCGSRANDSRHRQATVQWLAGTKKDTKKNLKPPSSDALQGGRDHQFPGDAIEGTGDIWRAILCCCVLLLGTGLSEGKFWASTALKWTEMDRDHDWTGSTTGKRYLVYVPPTVYYTYR